MSTVMQLSDSVSNLLQYPKLDHLPTFPKVADPTFLFDLKQHLENNPDYRAKRRAWAKTKPQYRSLYQIKYAFFEEWAENNLKLFEDDVKVFLFEHPDLNVGEATRAFCGKWKGYSSTYGEEFIRRAIQRFKQCQE
jgi:hypothetical protein